MSGLVLLAAGLVAAALALAWTHASARGEHRIALIATLGVLAAVYNVIIPVPNVEATTMIVVAAALVLGAPLGAAVGIVAIIGTSSVASVGVWTIWQVVATCAIALVAGIVGGALRAGARDAGTWDTWQRRIALLVLIAVATISYDVFTTWTTLHSFAGAQQRLGAALLAGIPFYVVHLLASTVLAALVGASLLNALERVRPRLDGGRVIS